MSINRDELKRLIDHIHEEDTVQVYNFISDLNNKRTEQNIIELEIGSFSEDKGLIHQIQQSRKERKSGLILNKEQGLKYLRKQIEEFESGQNL